MKQHHSAELDQSTETLRFHKFNNELLCLKIADLEERNKQLQESFEMVISACEHLVGDKEQLTTVVKSCLENLDSYKRRTMDGTSEKVIHGQNQVQQPVSECEPNCEWCGVVRAFYRICRPT